MSDMSEKSLNQIRSIVPLPVLDNKGNQTPAPADGGKWLTTNGKISDRSGNEYAWMYIKDGDSPYFAKALAGNADPNDIPFKDVPDVFGGRIYGINARETAKDGRTGNLYANDQWDYTTRLHTDLIENGYSIVLEPQSGDVYNRDAVREFIKDKDGKVVGDVGSVILTEGMAAPFTNHPTADTATQSAMEVDRLGQIARERKKGIWAKEDLWKTEDTAEEKRLKDARGIGRPEAEFNTLYWQDDPKHTELTNYGDGSRFKIGDTYLSIPPTSLQVSQVRTSYTVPMLGYVSKPTSSYTTRTVIKIQCVFENFFHSSELTRILLQYKYCPVNLVRSRDLFQKLTGVGEGGASKTGLSKAYMTSLERDYGDTWTVPVTMDEYTLYTMEGHPESMGAIFQFSIFNYTAYFEDNPLDRLEYFKFNMPVKAKNKSVDVMNMIQGKVVDLDYIKKYDKALYRQIEMKAVVVPDNKAILYRDKTLNLEQAIHPYNINVEADIDLVRDIFNELHGGAFDSSIKIWKVSTAVKPARQKDIEQPLSISQWTERLKESLVQEEIVSSISVKFENNFGWHPIIGYSQPVAQYIGPGATHVSINLKTENNATVAKLLKTYNEIVEKDELFGYYDDRYIVSSVATIFSGTELCSMKEVTAASIPGHPGWTDINMTFEKQEYDVEARSLNPAAKHDSYWGLNRLLGPLQDPAYKAAVEKVMATVEHFDKGETLLTKINKNKVNLDGVKPTVKDAMLILLDKLRVLPMFPASNFRDGKSRTGQEIYDRLTIIETSQSEATQEASLFTDLMTRFLNSVKKRLQGQTAINSTEFDEYLLFDNVLKKYTNNQLNGDDTVNAVVHETIDLAEGMGLLDHKVASQTPFLRRFENAQDRKTVTTAQIKELNGDQIKEALGPFLQRAGAVWNTNPSVTRANYESRDNNMIRFSFTGVSQEMAIIKAVLGIGGQGSQNKEAIESYKKYWKDNFFPEFLVGDYIVNKGSAPDFQTTYNITCIYVHKPGEGVSEFTDTRVDKADIAKAMQDAQKEIKNIDLKKYTNAKPYAAHRYYPGIEDFITHDAPLSSSVGDWFSDSKILGLDGLLRKINKMCDELQSPISDLPAWQAAFKSWGAGDKQMEMINKMITEAGPLGVLEAVAYPQLKKDLSDSITTKATDGSNDGKRNLGEGGKIDTKIYPLPAQFEETHAIRQVATKRSPGDEPFSSMSHLMFARSYFGIGTKFAGQQEKMLDNITAKQKYTYSSAIYNVMKYNTGMQTIVLPNSTTSKFPGEVTGSQITSGLVANADTVRSNVSKMIKYGSIYKKNSVAITRQKSVVGADMAMRSYGFSGFESDASKAIGMSPPDQIVNGEVTARVQRLSFNNYKSAGGTAGNKGTNNIKDVTPLTQKELDEINRLEAAKGEASQAQQYEMGRRYLLSQLPTSGAQHAFPTYKMYIISSDTSDYKFYSLDDYYDFRLVQDLMVVRDRNNPAHILKARVLIDPRYITISDSLKQKVRHDNEAHEGKPLVTPGPKLVDTADENNYSLGRVPLRVGMRICVKLGYHSDPRQMDTVFIGTIENLSGNMNTGIYDLDAKGDGRELCVPAATSNQEIVGENYSEIIATILKANPNVVHFGKCYGTFLERFSREHYVMMAIGRGMLEGGVTSSAALLGGAGGLGMTSFVLGGGALAKGLAFASVGAAVWGMAKVPYGPMYQAMTKGHLTHKFYAKNKTWVNSRLASLSAWWHGNIYDAEKASEQISAHIYKTYELNNDPIDDNIFAVDGWARVGTTTTMKVDNRRTIWSVMQDIKRMYPNYALDVRPYGNRSTVFLGPLEFDYWRTDDPLMAMAPQLCQISNWKLKYDDGINNALKMGIERDTYGNVDVERNKIGEDGIAPFIPFQKQHIITSYGDILLNGLRATPDQGWNEVVLSYGKAVNETNSSPEMHSVRANQNIEPGSIRKVYVQADWITNLAQAKQYAVGILKEGVEKMYGGSIVIRGNPKIEPHDRIYICDKTNKMYGWVEAATVIHKFDLQSGYTTHIVPNMVCSVNSDAYMASGHVARRLISDNLGKIGAMDIGLFIAGAFITAPALGFLGAALPFMMAVAGLGAGWLLVSGLRDKSEEMADKYGPKDEEKYIPELLNTVVTANMATASFNTGAVVGLLIRTVRNVKNAGVTDSVMAAYKVAAGQARNTTATITNWGTKNISQRSAVRVMSALGEEFMSSLKAMEDPKTAAAAIEKKLAEIKTSNPGLHDKIVKSIGEDGKGLKGLLKEYEKALEKVGARDVAAKAAVKSGQKAAIKIGTKNALKTGASTILHNGFMLAILGAIETIPLVFEGFCINAMTGANTIVVHPVWSRNALLLTGLEGYQTENAYLHMKNQVMFAKKSFGQAMSSLVDWTPTLYGGSAPDMTEAASMAQGSALRGQAGSRVGSKDKITAEEKASIKMAVTSVFREYKSLTDNDIKILLTMIQLESQYNIFAYNTVVDKSGQRVVNAAGLFQFVFGTGSDMQLKVDKTFNHESDERFNVSKTTHAAVKYYQDIKKGLQDRGIEATGPNIYICWNQGLGGGSSIIKGQTPNAELRKNMLNQASAIATDNPVQFVKNVNVWFNDAFAQIMAEGV